MATNLQMTFSNVYFWWKFNFFYSNFIVYKYTLDYKSAMVQVMAWHPGDITWTNDDPVHWCICMSLRLKELIWLRSSLWTHLPFWLRSWSYKYWPLYTYIFLYIFCVDIWNPNMVITVPAVGLAPNDVWPSADTVLAAPDIYIFLVPWAFIKHFK